MAKMTRPATATLRAVVAPLLDWFETRNGAEALRAKSPDQREDIGLTLRDMSRLGA